MISQKTVTVASSGLGRSVAGHADQVPVHGIEPLGGPADGDDRLEAGGFVQVQRWLVSCERRHSILLRE
jgi:hypothetical protein